MGALRRLHAAGAEPSSIADADLVLRAREGDAWAEDALYRRHARPVATMVARLLGQRQEVDDIVHDSFLAAFEQLDRLRDPQAFKAWLMQIAVTKVRRAIRKRRLLRRLGLLPSDEDLSLEQLASDAISPELRAELAVVDGVLRGMPATERIAWMLRYVEGHRLEDVAALTSCSLATAKRRIASADATMHAVISVRPPSEDV